MADAVVQVTYRDFTVLWVAEAKFSKDKPEENVFYVGCFGRWFNVNAQLISAISGLLAARPTGRASK